MRVYQDYRNTLMRTGSDFVEAKKIEPLNQHRLLVFSLLLSYGGQLLQQTKLH